MGSGECALPWKDECGDDSFVCYNTSQCQSHYWQIYDWTYCDPGNNRCMVKQYPGCAKDYI